MDIHVIGDWNETLDFLKNADRFDFNKKLNEIGARGVNALKNATPRETGLASASWDYLISSTDYGLTVEWHNYDIEGGYNVAILVEYGHGLHQGGRVSANDFINPALESIFDNLADELWKEVCGL